VLACAAERSHEAVVRVLLEGKNKVLVNAEDSQDCTALSWAAGGDRDKAATYLLEMGADAEIQDVHGRTPLLWAATLLDHGADIECPDTEERTALSWAAGKEQEGIVKLILQRGGIVMDTQDKRGRTPLLWSTRSGHVAIVELLIKWAKISSRVRRRDYDGIKKPRRLNLLCSSRRSST
jgi:ankyrin repeat protein